LRARGSAPRGEPEQRIGKAHLGDPMSHRGWAATVVSGIESHGSLARDAVF
jgi:hypothetical protein